MNNNLYSIQQVVDDRVKKDPKGYFPDEKILAKIDEEFNEIKEALKVYNENTTDENLKALKTEIGDILFAICCLSNTKNIMLNDCFDLMMEKNKEREKNNYEK